MFSAELEGSSMAKNNNNNIEEVKNILLHLQSMERHPETGMIEIGYGRRNSLGALTGRSVVSVVDTNRLPALPQDDRPANLATYLVSAIVAISLVGGSIGFILFSQQPSKIRKVYVSKVKNSSNHERNTEDLLFRIKRETRDKFRIADQLMRSGDIASARSILLEIVNAEAKFSVALYSKTLLMLAKSYDPNVLRTIPRADSEANTQQARYWYTLWHQHNLKHGTTSSSEELTSILNAME